MHLKVKVFQIQTRCPWFTCQIKHAWQFNRPLIAVTEQNESPVEVKNRLLRQTIQDNHPLRQTLLCLHSFLPLLSLAFFVFHIEALLSLNVQQMSRNKIDILNISHHLCYRYFYFHNSLPSTWLAISNF